MRSSYKVADKTVQAQLLQRAETQLIVDEKTSTIALKALGDDEYRVTANEASTSAYAIARGEQFFIHLNGRHYLVECEDEAHSSAQSGSAADKTIASAPMPGTVISVNVETGQTVKENDTLMVIESMKMETTINAWRDGVIATINVNVGDSFDRMAALIELEE